MPRTLPTEIPEAIAARRSFQSNSLSADRHPKPSSITYGELSETAADRLDDVLATREVTYLIYSFHTPIAWEADEAAWYVVTDDISASTEKHQRLVREILDELRAGETS